MQRTFAINIVIDAFLLYTFSKALYCGAADSIHETWFFLSYLGLAWWLRYAGQRTVRPVPTLLYGSLSLISSWFGTAGEGGGIALSHSSTSSTRVTRTWVVICDRFRFFKGLEAAMGQFCVCQKAAGTRWGRREGGGPRSASASALLFCSNGGGGRDRGKHYILRHRLSFFSVGRNDGVVMHILALVCVFLCGGCVCVCSGGGCKSSGQHGFTRPSTKGFAPADCVCVVHVVSVRRGGRQQRDTS